MNKKLFLIDAYALIFRGYYALIKNPRINSKGLDTSAILGFINSLFDILKRENPEYLAVAFDKGGSNYREEIFIEYKANRTATPEPILVGVPYIKAILKAMDIPIIEQAGYEADDLIGTLSVKASKKDYQVYMVTPDKDFAQLVNSRVFMYKPSKKGSGIEIWGEKEVIENFEVETPSQIIDLLAMMGDAVDNIPGLPGVGQKTAIKLLKEYKSIENVLENSHHIKGKLGEKITANKHLGLLSKQLATILLDCPIAFDEETFKVNCPNHEQVLEILEELEFKRFKQQYTSLYNIDEQNKDLSTQTNLFDNSKKIENHPTIHNTYFFQIIEGSKGISLLETYLLKAQKSAFQIDTSDNIILGIAFSWQSNIPYYLCLKELTDQKIKLLQNYFSNSNLKIGINLKEQFKLLNTIGIQINTKKYFDIALAHYCIFSDYRNDLDTLLQLYKVHFNKELQEEEPHSNLLKEVDTLKMLYEKIWHSLLKIESEKVFSIVETPLLKVLLEMEEEGITLRKDILLELSEQVNEKINSIEQIIYNLADYSFNIGSPKQLGELLFEKLKIIDKPKKTKTGQYSTSEEVLNKLKNTHPIIKEILSWRHYVKLKNTYIDTLPLQINNSTGKIHTTFSQTLTATGRLSSKNPNLQNIPIRTNLGKSIRKAFVPTDEESILMSADYSQVELRIIASLSGDEKMIEAFENKKDIHTSTASYLFNVPIQDVTPLQRSHAKTVNFGIIYGVSAFGLSNQTNLSRTESKELIESYFKTYPKLKEYTISQINFAREKGYVETILGRKRELSGIFSNNNLIKSEAERNAVNMPVQGSAADIIKIAMININKQIKTQQLKSKLLLQIHDELILNVKKTEKEQITSLVITEMEQAYNLKVPLEVDYGFGNNWFEAH